MDGGFHLFAVWRSMVELKIDLWATTQWTCRQLRYKSMLEQKLWGVSDCNKVYKEASFAYWAAQYESLEVNSESNPLERKDAEGPSLDESLENEGAIGCIFVIQIPEEYSYDSNFVIKEGCIRGNAWNEFEDDARGNLVFHSQVIAVITTEDNEDVRPLMLMKKTPSVPSISTSW
ncbi:hypothetical protein Tco_0928481 [Tanacetum coccineum]